MALASATQWRLECPLGVKGCLREDVGSTFGVPEIAADLLHRAKSAESGQNRKGFQASRMTRRSGIGLTLISSPSMLGALKGCCDRGHLRVAHHSH
jgi:hypothetical protein